MEIDEKINILRELISGCEELTEHQNGWEIDIEKGYDFLEILTKELEDNLKNK
jgi:hypothetical protein